MKPNIFRTILTPTLLPHWSQDLLLALPRIVGCYFLIGFGWSKFPCPAWFVTDVAALGLPLPFLFAWAAVLTEVFGSVALILGFGTRIAGFLLVCTMLVAVLLQKAEADLWEKLPSMGYLWLGFAAMATGSGRFGLDFLLFKPKQKALLE